jgi:hypothetical protein
MSRMLIVLSLSAIVGSALPAMAGPNGSSVAPYFPLDPQLNAPRGERPYGLLGDAGQRSRDRAPRDLRDARPARGWLRRPSEGK